MEIKKVKQEMMYKRVDEVDCGEPFHLVASDGKPGTTVFIKVHCPDNTFCVISLLDGDYVPGTCGSDRIFPINGYFVEELYGC